MTELNDHLKLLLRGLHSFIVVAAGNPCGATRRTRFTSNCRKPGENY